MPRRASGRLAASLDFTEENDTLGVGDGIAAMRHRISIEAQFSSGTGEGQVDRVWSFTGTATTTPADADLAGSLASAIGAGNVVLAEIVAILVKNTGSTNNLLLGGVANGVGILNGATDEIVILPGGGLLYYPGPAGLAVANGSSDQLRFAAAASTTTYQVTVVGRSA
jgi:hypothetical protein